MTSIKSRKRNLLILDLDETLVFATEAPLDRPADFSAFQFQVYRRPYLDEFITVCFEYFDVAVWSSASDDYVRRVVEAVFPKPELLQFVWGRSRASLPRSFVDMDGYFHSADHQNYRKPLVKVKKLGWRLENIVIVDDTPSKSRQNFGNAVYPRPWEGELGDDELSQLASYLPTLADCPNLRRVEKRNWRSETLGRKLLE